MAITDKPAILIIGGAFHVPKSYQILTTALESAGYEVVSVISAPVYAEDGV